MYVCVCKAVSESRIRQAVAEGARSLRDLRNSHGLGTGCGKCVPHAHEFLKGCLEDGDVVTLQELRYGLQRA